MSLKKIKVMFATVLFIILGAMTAKASGYSETIYASTYEKNYIVSNNVMSYIDEHYSELEHGGYYLSEDGTLNLNITSDTNRIKSEIKEQTGTSVKIHVVEFSYEALERAMTVLSPRCEEFDLAIIMEDIINNRIEIKMYDLDKKDALLDFIVNDCGFSPDMFVIQKMTGKLVFANSDSEIETNSDPIKKKVETMATKVTLTPGQKININNRSSSLGFAPNSSYMYTAGHSCNVGDLVYVDGFVTPIGKIESKKFSGNCDAARLKLNTGFTASLKLPSGVSYSSGLMTNRSFVVGTQVSLQGAYSGRQNGTIRASSTTVHYTNVTLTDMVQANYTVRRGDSGGGIFGTWNNIVHGIQSGANLPDNVETSNVAFFTKYDNIVSNNI